MESVQTRQRGSLDFEGYYRQLCALQDTCPLASVKNHLAEGVLDLNGDRIRAPDWMPILNALRINKSLNFVGVRSYYQNSPGSEDSKDGKIRSRVKRRPPPIRSKDFTYRLGVALKETLSASRALTHLELQGIPLRNRDVQLIAKGILKNTSLQHLSLESSRIGDRGVETLCQGIKNSPSITSLNFSASGLTNRGADALAKLVKHQSTQRHSEAWKDSLRYRRPDLDRMAGIRRITLNHNPLVNDDGALAFADALKDDLWLKALDMQHCGLSNLGAKAFLDGLHQNSTVVVLDIRRNDLIDRDLLKAVLKQVMINAGEEENEYKWLRLNRTQEHSSKPRRRTKTLNSNFGRKTTIRVTSVPSSAPARSNRHSVHATRKNAGEDFTVPSVTKPGPGFVPWRTAARACQRRTLPEGPQIQVDSSPSLTPTKSTGSVHVHTASTTSSGELETSCRDMDTPVLVMGLEDEGNMVDKQVRRKMQVELEELHRRLYIESRARAAADAHVVELEVANSRLRHQLQLLEARRLPSSPLRATTSGPSDSAVDSMEDETILDSIEESFAKFHEFLDLLKEAGLGQLCTLVGMSPGEIRNPHVRSILRKHQPAPVGTAHPVDGSTPDAGEKRGNPRNLAEGPSTETVSPDVTQGMTRTDTSDRQVYVHAPLVSQQESNGREKPESLRKIPPVSESHLTDATPRPVVVHPSLSEPPVPQRRTHLAKHTLVSKPKKCERDGADVTKHIQADFDEEIQKPHIEFTSKGLGSSGDARIQRPGEEKDRPTPTAEQETDNLNDEEQQHSDKEPSSHKSVSSHSHRTSTPTGSKVTPPGSDDPTAATYSIDEDHESFGSSVSDKDLFAEVLSPVQAIKNGHPGMNNEKDLGGDEFSSDEDF